MAMERCSHEAIYGLRWDPSRGGRGAGRVQDQYFLVDRTETLQGSLNWHRARYCVHNNVINLIVYNWDDKDDFC